PAADRHDEEEDDAEHDRDAAGPAEHAAAEQVLQVDLARTRLGRRSAWRRRRRDRRGSRLGRAFAPSLPQETLDPFDPLLQRPQASFDAGLHTVPPPSRYSISGMGIP